jgi:hypothetical protein
VLSNIRPAAMTLVLMQDPLLYVVVTQSSGLYINHEEQHEAHKPAECVALLGEERRYFKAGASGSHEPTSPLRLTTIPSLRPTAAAGWSRCRRNRQRPVLLRPNRMSWVLELVEVDLQMGH